LLLPALQVGLCDQAVEAFKKAGDVKAAIDCCVLLNQWDQAVSLAETHEFPQVGALVCCLHVLCACCVAAVVVNVNELRLGFSNTTRNPVTGGCMLSRAQWC
jgi:hypothetical protein